MTRPLRRTTDDQIEIVKQWDGAPGRPRAANEGFVRNLICDFEALQEYADSLEGLSAPESADHPGPDPTPAGKPRRQRDAVARALLGTVGDLAAGRLRYERTDTNHEEG